MKIQSIRQPVIAEVQGIATAAGCQLVASCDLAIAAENASFATPGVGSAILHNADGCAQSCNRSQASAGNASDWGDDQRGDGCGMGVDQPRSAGVCPAGGNSKAREMHSKRKSACGGNRQAVLVCAGRFVQAEAYAYARQVMSRALLPRTHRKGWLPFSETSGVVAGNRTANNGPFGRASVLGSSH